MARKATRVRSAWRSLTRAERTRVAGMLAVIVVNALGWGIFALEILPRHFHYKGLGVAIGVAVTAWALGLRHAFDADNIAAIGKVEVRWEAAAATGTAGEAGGQAQREAV
jgi:nickel/cobalt transporter (NiCoT) family protein